MSILLSDLHAKCRCCFASYIQRFFIVYNGLALRLLAHVDFKLSMYRCMVRMGVDENIFILTGENLSRTRFILAGTLVHNGPPAPVEWHRQSVLGSLLGYDIFRDTLHPCI